MVIVRGWDGDSDSERMGMVIVRGWDGDSERMGW